MWKYTAIYPKCKENSSPVFKLLKNRCFLESISDQDSKATLGELGTRVRAWRARRGMTRKALASDSGLSERFLADVESGKGNVSINSLEAAARALNISILELLQDAPRPALARAQGLLSKIGRAHV